MFLTMSLFPHVGSGCVQLPNHTSAVREVRRNGGPLGQVCRQFSKLVHRESQEPCWPRRYIVHNWYIRILIFVMLYDNCIETVLYCKI